KGVLKILEFEHSQYPEKIKAITEFNRFFTYFKGFNGNRTNYSCSSLFVSIVIGAIAIESFKVGEEPIELSYSFNFLRVLRMFKLKDFQHPFCCKYFMSLFFFIPIVAFKLKTLPFISFFQCIS